MTAPEDELPAPNFVRRHPELRWVAVLVVAAAVGVLVGTAVAGSRRRDADLTITSPQSLVALLRLPHTGGWSGVATTDIDVGLPLVAQHRLAQALPVADLFDGAHTLRWWYGGPARQRVAVVRARSEQDVVRRDDALWTWDSTSRVAHQVALPGAQTVIPLELGTAADLAPPVLADALIQQLGDDAQLTLRSGPHLADRPTYELDLRPDVAGSTISLVKIQVDGDAGVPLGVEVYAAGNAVAPVLATVFTSVSFTPPAPQNFTFQLPADSTLAVGQPLGALTADAPGAAVVGTGWLRRLAFQPDLSRRQVVRAIMRPTATAASIRGPFGRGRVLRVGPFTLLVSQAGDVAFGPVTPAVLEAALPALAGPHGRSRSRHG